MLIMYTLGIYCRLQTSAAVQVAVVLPERKLGTAELYGNTDIVESTGEHVTSAKRHCSRALGGPSSGLGPHGNIEGEEQLRRFAALNTSAGNVGTTRGKILQPSYLFILLNPIIKYYITASHFYNDYIY